MYDRLDSIPACDRGTDVQTSYYGIVQVMHTCRAVKIQRCDRRGSQGPFYRATRTHSADYAVIKCPSVCLSVCLCVRHTPVLCVNRYTYLQSFFHLG